MVYDFQSANPSTYHRGVHEQYDSRYVPQTPFGAPPPPSTAPADYVDPREVERAVALRNAALMRMREMSCRHAMHAFDQRNGADALGPHAVAFLFHDVDRRPGLPAQYVIKAATRLFRDDDEVRDLPRLLHTLAGIAGQYADRGQFDVRRMMAHRSDEMSVQAQFAGVGVSTLDTPAGQWVNIRQHSSSALQVAGRSYMQLLDGTQMILDCGGAFGVVGTTYSSNPLEAGQQMAYGTWQRLRRIPHDPAEAVWGGIDLLHQQVYRGSGAEFAARSSSRHR